MAGWLAELEGTRRLLRVRIAGQERWAAVEDAGRLRDALGTPLPVGVAEAFTEPVADPLGDLVSRYARTHGPFTAARLAARFGLGPAVVADVLRRFVATGRLAEGELRPLDSGGGRGTDYCDAEVLRTLRRRSLAALRAEVEPVPVDGPGPVPARLAGGRRHGPRRGRAAADGRATGRGLVAGQRTGDAGAAVAGSPTTARRCSTS